MIALDLLLPEKPRPLKRDEYDRLVAMGAFEGERVELLRGTIVAMSPQDPGHASPIGRLTNLLVRALPQSALVRVQLPILAVDESEPEPDFAVVQDADYRQTHPDRAHLVIEVALSSMRKDRFVKAPLYAQSGFTEYWLVDVTTQTVEVYRGPSPEGYRTTTTHGTGESIAIEAFPDVVIRVADIFA